LESDCRRDFYLTTQTLTTDFGPHAPGRFRTCNSRKRAAAGTHLRPCPHWDRCHCL